jgi:hypothetical protein
LRKGGRQAKNNIHKNQDAYSNHCTSSAAERITALLH